MNNSQERKILYDESNNILPLVSNWHYLINDRWMCQKEAYEKIRRYLKNKDNIKYSMLIRMPTGTGKTGIMALVSNYSIKIKNILIVVPSKYLRKQVEKEINYKFWINVNGQPIKGVKQALTFVPSTLCKLLKNIYKSKGKIFICTTQTLNLLNIDKSEKNEKWLMNFKKLHKVVDLVIVDEGHREPAKRWAKAVRSFNKPILLFSATPYRNDLRFFTIGRGIEYRYTLTFQEALEEKLIRNVRFIEEEFSEINGFSNRLIEFYYNNLQRIKPKEIKKPKVIIRCEDFNTVKSMKNSLLKILEKRTDRLKAKENVIAIHDKFNVGEEKCNNFKNVPERNEAIFWIHQFKLTEGLDNKDFCLLAFFNPFKNARSLIQQIGRVIRNKSGNKNSRSIVFSNLNFYLKEQWEGYLAFEKSRKSIISPEEIVERILKYAFPDWYYYKGYYRKSVNFNDTKELVENLRFRKTMSIYKIKNTSIKKKLINFLIEEISEYLADKDIVEIREARNIEKTVNGYLIILSYWKINQSENIEKKGFFNIKYLPLFIYINLKNKFLFYQGTLKLNTIESIENALSLKLIDDNCVYRSIRTAIPKASGH